MNPRLFLVPIAAFAVAALVACGGDKKDASVSSGGSTTSSQASAAGTAGQLDLGKVSTKLDELKSFRFEMAMKLDGTLPTGGTGSSSQDDMLGAALLGMLSDFKMDGAYVAPDKIQVKTKVMGQDLEFISIAEKSWVKFGNTWQANQPSSGTTGSSSSGSFGDMIPDEVLKGAKTSSETVNGVKATKYAFDKAALEQMAKDAGEDTSEFKDLDKADVNLWLSNENVPVKMTMNISGKDAAGKKASVQFEINLKNVNDGGINIKAPI